MKKVIMALALVLMVATYAVATTGGSHGITSIPLFVNNWSSAQSFVTVSVNVTNILSEDVTCSVRVYDHNGDDKSTYSFHGVYTGAYGSSGSGSLSSSPTFTVPAKSTRVVYYYLATPFNIQGHAIVEWESTSGDIDQALQGGVINSFVTNGVYSFTTYLLNEGKPF